MIFMIEPYVRAGEIEFGMSQAQVRKLFPDEPIVAHHQDLWDIYHEIGLQVAFKYEPPHICQAVMFYKPANVSVLSYDLLEVNSIKNLKEIFENLNFKLLVNTEGIIINELGVFLSTQDYEIFENEPPESVVAFVQGYYDHLSLS
jgi:hypothetical protein